MKNHAAESRDELAQQLQNIIALLERAENSPEAKKENFIGEVTASGLRTFIDAVKTRKDRLCATDNRTLELVLLDAVPTAHDLDAVGLYVADGSELSKCILEARALSISLFDREST